MSGISAGLSGLESGAMEAAWTRHQAGASGQVFEFRLWAALIEQSRGGLHIFLPLSDRGIDALVHRLSDGIYFRVQAKGRSSLIGGEVALAVWASALLDDDALLVAGLVVEGGLGPTMLVVPVREFKRLADLTSAHGAAVYSTGFGMKPRSDSRWQPWLVPAESLIERFGSSPAGVAMIQAVAPDMWRSDLGFLAEAETIRRLAEAPELNIYRPFPDLETAEVVAVPDESNRGRASNQGGRRGSVAPERDRGRSRLQLPPIFDHLLRRAGVASRRVAVPPRVSTDTFW